MLLAFLASHPHSSPPREEDYVVFILFVDQELNDIEFVVVEV
jgi:hypothetical protein